MKIRPGGVELFHADRLADVTKLIVVFRKQPQKVLHVTKITYTLAADPLL